MHTLASVTHVTLNDTVASIIIILAFLGLYDLFKSKSMHRMIALIAIVGVLVVSIPFIHDLAIKIRTWIDGLFASHGWSDLAGGIAFSLLMLLLIAGSFALHTRAKEKNNNFLYLMLFFAALLCTVGAVADGLFWLIHASTEVLKALGK